MVRHRMPEKKTDHETGPGIHPWTETPKQRALLRGAVLVAATLWIFVLKRTRFAGYEDAVLGIETGRCPEQYREQAGGERTIAYEISPDGTRASRCRRTNSIADGWRRPRKGCRGMRDWGLKSSILRTGWVPISRKGELQRAMEGELERTIQTLGEVEAVRVHLVMPSESLFSEREQEGKAAVIVKTHGACRRKSSLRSRSWWRARWTSCGRKT